MLWESGKGRCALPWQKLLGTLSSGLHHRLLSPGISDLFTADSCTQQGHVNEVTDRSDASQAMGQNTQKKSMKCHSNRGEEFTCLTSSQLRAHWRAETSATFSSRSLRLGKGRPDSGQHHIYCFLPKRVLLQEGWARSCLQPQAQPQPHTGLNTGGNDQVKSPEAPL